MSSDQNAFAPHSKRTLGRNAGSSQIQKRSNQSLHDKSYEYEALEPGHIRILVLSPLEEFGNLSGMLETARLDDGPEYKAISYAWGEPVFDHTLRLAGGVLRITASLASALRRFRGLTRPVRLWADAVCIDQYSIAEKNHQVATMAEIYRAAEEVCIWLGEADAIDTERFWLLDTYASGYKRHESEGGSQSSPYPVIPSQGDSLACPCCNLKFTLVTSSPDEAAILSLGLWERPWFRRLWVVQEATSAAKAIFFCGSHQLTIEDYLTVSISLHSYFLDRGYTKYREALENDIISREYNMSLATRNCASRILSLLLCTPDRGCSDQHDHLYAILGLYGTRATPLPLPDYSVETDDLWKDLSSIILTVVDHWNSDEKIVGYAHPAFALVLAGLQQHENDRLPSWAMDLGGFIA